VYVDDEDEFAEHQVRYSYPPDVVEAARASRDRLVTLLSGRHPPYDGTADRWLERLAHTDSSADHRDFFR
jgi:protein associated with RNAse G/E